MKWSIEKIHLPLKFDWKISRNTSEAKTNFLVRVEDAGGIGEGEVAFNVRYGESAELVTGAFQDFLARAEDFRENDLEAFSDFLRVLPLPLSLRFAIESAFVHYQAQRTRQPVWRLLELPPPPAQVATSFSLPILEVGEIAAFMQEHRLNRFPVLKIKVDQMAVDRVKEVAKYYSGPLRVDANEAWQTVDEVLAFLEEVKRLPLQFIEQPLPADKVEESVELKKHAAVTLIADEAVTSGEVTADYRDRYHGVNIKLMKSGGYLQAVRQLQQARRLGLQTMLGCMVETSVGISSAFCLAAGVDYFDLDGFLLLQEEPFGWLAEDGGCLSLTDLGRQRLAPGL